MAQHLRELDECSGFIGQLDDDPSNRPRVLTSTFVEILRPNLRDSGGFGALGRREVWNRLASLVDADVVKRVGEGGLRKTFHRPLKSQTCSRFGLVAQLIDASLDLSLLQQTISA